MLTKLGTFVAVDNTALNVVCNQEYAQVVPHVRLKFFLSSLLHPISLSAGSLPYNSCPEVQHIANWLGSQRSESGTGANRKGHAPKRIRVAR